MKYEDAMEFVESWTQSRTVDECVKRLNERGWEINERQASNTAAGLRRTGIKLKKMRMTGSSRLTRDDVESINDWIELQEMLEEKLC